MSDSDHVPATLQADYEAIESAVMETEKGRWFLAEYARRNRTADTAVVLDAIAGLERQMRRSKRPDIDRIRLDIGEMKDAIERTKREIAQIKNDQNASSRFDKASNELDAIVSQTEAATSEILSAAEKIQEIAWTMREGGLEPEICDAIEQLTTTIYMSCSFQDLTGQRTQKVVHVLRYLESRIDAMIDIWGMDDDAGDADGRTTVHAAMEVHTTDASAPPRVEPDLPSDLVDTRPDAHLLNGPALEGEGIDQGDVDSLMSADGDAAVDLFDGFDPIDTGADEEVADDAATEVVADVADEAEVEADELTEAAMAALGELDWEDAADASEGAVEETAGTEPPGDEASEAEPDEAEVLSRATEAMEEAIETLQKVSEAVRPDSAAEKADPLATLSRAERQALFS